MAVSMSSKQKVYQDVLNEIRNFIQKHNLQSGDKLPSERDLTEKLQASRSSIREALRSMELLGLITVRHGEGTFLSTYHPFHTVELLASFILLESNTKNDILFVKQSLEKEGAKFAFDFINNEDLKELNSIILQHDNDSEKIHVAFFEYLFNKSNNLFLIKIWGLMHEFSRQISQSRYEQPFYTALVNIYETGNFQAIEKLFTDQTTQKAIVPSNEDHKTK